MKRKPQAASIVVAVASAAVGAAIAGSRLARNKEAANEVPAVDNESDVEQPTPAPETSLSWTDTLKDNATVLTAALTTFFIAMRIFSAGGYSLATAYGILQAGGTGTVVIGATLSLVGIFSAWFAMLCLLSIHSTQVQKSRVKRNIAIGLIVLFTVIAIYSSPALNLFFLAITLAFEIYAHFPPITRKAKEARKRAAEITPADFERYIRESGLKLKKPDSKPFPVTTAILFALTLFSVLANTTPWLPSEEITLTNSKPITGYILSVSQPFTAILVSGQPRIIYVDTANIIGRKICIIGFTGVAWRTLPELTIPQPYPSCP